MDADGGVMKYRALTNGETTVSNSSYGTVGTTRSFTMYTDTQRTYSVSHPGFNNLDATRDTGGMFDSTRVRVPYPGVRWQARHNFSKTFDAWQYESSAFLVAHSDMSAYSSLNSPNVGGSESSVDNFLSTKAPPGQHALVLNAQGTKAIDMVKPDNPTVDLATSLAELWSERKFFSRPGSSGSVSGEYLNYQFGIAPTVSDFQDLRKAIENRDAILRQYQRDSKNVIRRKYQFEPIITSKVETFSRPCASIGVSLNTAMNPGGTVTKRTKTTETWWFSGAFRYSIPKESFPKQLSELDRLYGVVPGVSTGWELVPFSWLVDYFVPVGSLLSNIDSFMQHGLVIPYAYIMCTTEVDTEYHWTGPLKNDAGAFVQADIVNRVISTRKQRQRATPFGFGLLAGDLSPKQLSILAALGMSMRK